MRLKQPYAILFLLLLVSCVTTTKENDKLPKSSLIKGYDVSNDDILYQFYEEFGFDEICTHTRSYFKVENFKTKEGWVKLPMSKKDVLKLRLIPNKIDTLKGKTLDVKYAYKLFFDDISLDRKEHVNDTDPFENEISLEKGYYKIDGSTFLIYNTNNRIYYEEHYCNN